MLDACPLDAGPLYTAAVAARSSARPKDAALLLALGSALHPKLPDFYRVFGNLQVDAKRYTASTAYYRHALGRDALDHTTYRSLALSFTNMNRPDLAHRLYQQSIALGGPNSFKILDALTLPTVVQDAGELTRARIGQMTAVTKAAAEPPRIEDPLAEIGVTNFLAAYHGEDDRALQEAFATALIGGHPGLTWTAPDLPARAPRADGRHHVVVASASFFDHTISRLYLGLVRDLPRDRFVVTVARTTRIEDPVTAAVDAAADHVVRLPMDLKAAREAVAACRPDLLFYPDLGMEPLTYLMAFARLAPVQMTTLGHPVTTGIPNVDGFLSGAKVEPENAQDHYSEKLWLTPSLPMPVDMPPVPTRRPSKQAIGLSDDTPVYACPQTLFKFHPDFDDIILRLLGRNAQSRLVLVKGHSEWVDALLQRWERKQPGSARQIVLVNPMPRRDYIGLMALADVALETRPFGGGNSVVEALAVGTPVVTWPARYARGRCAKSVLEDMALHDLVVEDADTYIELAHRLAHDPGLQSSFRTRILAGRGRLIRPAEVTAEIAAVFEDAIALAKHGK